MYTFDGPNKLIIIDTGITAFDVQDMYSRWKDWMLLTDNSKYAHAFTTIGGQTVSPTNLAPRYFFLMNGWRIRPHEADHTLIVTGNLATDGGIDDPFVQTVGDFNVQIQSNLSTSPVAVPGELSTTAPTYLDLGDIHIPLDDNEVVVEVSASPATAATAGTYNINVAPATLTLASSLVAQAGAILIIKDRTGTANATDMVITINTEGVETIDGDTELLLTAPYAWIQLESDGINWGVIA